MFKSQVEFIKIMFPSYKTILKYAYEAVTAQLTKWCVSK